MVIYSSVLIEHLLADYKLPDLIRIINCFMEIFLLSSIFQFLAINLNSFNVRLNALMLPLKRKIFIFIKSRKVSFIIYSLKVAWSGLKRLGDYKTEHVISW